MCMYNATWRKDALRNQFCRNHGWTREGIPACMDHSPRDCGVIRHDQTEDLSPNATAGVVDCGERLRCHRVKIQKSSGRESHLEVVLTQGKTREMQRLFKA
jgi:hypothetical protein